MKLTKAQKTMKKRIENAYRKKGGFRYQNPLWDKKLWGRTNYEIREFFLKIFETTLDEVEYYSAIIYLWRTVSNAELLVEFHESPQWIEAAKTYDSSSDGEGTSQPLKEKNTVNKNGQKLTKIKYIEANGIKNIPTIKIIGGNKE